MNRQRVAAIIIQNKKILLVRDAQADFFSMPGGAIDPDEDQPTALAREVQEEIGVPMEEAEYFYSYDLMNQVYRIPQTDHTYIVSIDTTPIPSSEIVELGWFSKDDIMNKTVKVDSGFYSELFLKLVEEKLF